MNAKETSSSDKCILCLSLSVAPTGKVTKESLHRNCRLRSRLQTVGVASQCQSPYDILHDCPQCQQTRWSGPPRLNCGGLMLTLWLQPNLSHPQIWTARLNYGGLMLTLGYSPIYRIHRSGQPDKTMGDWGWRWGYSPIYRIHRSGQPDKTMGDWGWRWGYSPIHRIHRSGRSQTMTQPD
jgi:hypothetical protein